MNSKGNILVRLAMLIPLLLISYVSLFIFNTVGDDLLFPTLANMRYGNEASAILLITPIIVVILIISFLILGPPKEPRQETFTGFPQG